MVVSFINTIYSVFPLEKEGGNQSIHLLTLKGGEKRMRFRKRAEQDFHDQVVQHITLMRFGFPDAEHPHWQTYTNHPERSMPVYDHEGNVHYPDIVVVDTSINEAKLIGEVETSDTVNKEESMQWSDYSRLGHLYLYVPQGYSSLAKSLANNITIAGFRQFYVSNGTIEIKNC